jgi:hypothetical protein
MRRALALIAVLCVVGVAIAQATGQASAPADTRLQANKAAARRDARALVASLRLPSGATRLPARSPTVSSVGVTGHAKWTSVESQQAVIDYIKSHEPVGAKLQSWGHSFGPGIGTQLSLIYSWPSVGLELYNRSLSISVGALTHGHSDVFATSQSDWIVPRPLSEHVPSGVHAVEVTLRSGGGSQRLSHPHTTTHVFTRAAVVESLVRWIDELPTVQPGLIYACPLELVGLETPLLTVTFRSSAAGPALARAQVRVSSGRNGASGWTSCDPIEFWIGHTQQTALTSQTFVKRIGKLIGANIS